MDLSTISSLNAPELLIGLFFKYWWIFLILIALKAWQLPRVKGWVGEKLVDRQLKRLPEADYHILHDLYLPRPDGKGTTQIDHLVISRFGIFVIETKNYSNWIFGSEKQRQWTQKVYKKSYKFQNPLHQNALHINALCTFLNIDKELCHNVVYFVGDCTFKTKMPSNVLNRGLISYIKTFQQELLTEEQVSSLTEQLTSHDQAMHKKQVAKQHMESLRSNEKLGMNN